MPNITDYNGNVIGYYKYSRGMYRLKFKNRSAKSFKTKQAMNNHISRIIHGYGSGPSVSKMFKKAYGGFKSKYKKRRK